MRRPWLLLVAVVLVGAGLLWTRAYDLDQDGWLDSISLGSSAVHLTISRGEPRVPSASQVDGGRLYRIPPAYVNLLVKKTFDWDSRWQLLHWDADTRVSEAVRHKDKARVSVQVDEWRGWTVVRVSVRDAGTDSRAAVAGAVFQCLETVLFNGIATPQMVRGFAPRY